MFLIRHRRHKRETAKQTEREQTERAEARRWQRDCWEWQQNNPGVPVMEGVVTRDASAIRWNGPEPRNV